eukprot:TRINITY_DN5760_c0_g1_i1.p1 TRINITY_DN5760_c0_g1~~TRINITY_DN5760_c0_g1_i1.p1  ORF type:complete len:108 (+),score=8.42 TRINITY_DN5760_c0_g1_i1:157-480(+)
MSCMTIMNSPMLSMGLLFMGEGSEIPLHDHPGMLVTSKVLAGELVRHSFDLQDISKQFTFSRMDLMEIEDDPLEAFTCVCALCCADLAVLKQSSERKLRLRKEIYST